jgi:hypothetical protein
MYALTPEGWLATKSAEERFPPGMFEPDIRISMYTADDVIKQLKDGTPPRPMPGASTWPNSRRHSP